MLSHRQQYRILLTAVVFALIAVAFFAAYQGVRHWDESHGLSILIGKKGHPRPFSADWFMEDPVAFATFGLALFTAALFTATVWMAREAREASNAALKASTRATETLIATERPYVTGGGGLVEVRYDGGSISRMDFGLTVANYGKTPALLTHYDVQFSTLTEVQAGPIEISKRHRHYDWLAPRPENVKQLAIIQIPDFQTVVFGGFWYLDFQKQEHCFRFILTIEESTTYPDIADLVDASYTHWD